MQSPKLVGIDSNILLALAEEDDEAIDAWEVIRSRLRPVMLIASPTVFEELAYKAASGSSEEIAGIAEKALREIRSRWMIQLVELRSEQESLVELLARRFFECELLPTAERNDALILAETTVIECALLVSEDSHLHAVDRAKLDRVAKEFDLAAPLIASPRELVRKFY